jgi:Pentapeptide repeats (8 copies)
MANDEHVALLKQGVDAWNAWRDENPKVVPDLSGANLMKENLVGANLSEADLSDANLREANLREADLSGANLFRADFTEADLRGANLSGANLREADLDVANLSRANLSGASLREADLSGANLREANLREADLFLANLSGANLSGANISGADLVATALVAADLTGADLTGCCVYGVSAWRLKLDGAKQQNLVITGADEPAITVDNIEVAQFVYLLLHNEKIRDVIDTIGRKGVLLLGRFTEGRMVILERLREKLRDLGFVPMVFNFDKPETKDFSETVRVLASLSKFVIVDITNPRSAPLELQATVPDYMVPFVPILQQGEQPFSMFVDLQNKYDWVLRPVVGYPSVDRLIEVLEDKVVRPAEAKFNELLARRTKLLRVENV